MVKYTRANPEDVLSAQGLEDLQVLQQISAVRSGLQSGGWIAGGAIRAILSGKALQEYVFSRPMAGDIDIFFPSTQAAEAALKNLSGLTRMQTGMRSFGGSAAQLFDCYGSSRQQQVSVQYVDKEDLCAPSIESCMMRFDFVNCMVAFDGQKIVMPIDWHKIEERKQLHINNASSPFLASRISKYVKWRGYTGGITDESRDTFVDWLIRSHDSGNFSRFDATSLRALERVKDIGHVMTGQELLLFVGKWTDTQEARNYGKTVSTEVDWAVNHINSLSSRDAR